MDIDGTANSDEDKIIKDLSGVKVLLRLHGEPAQNFDEDIDAVRVCLRQIMSSQTDPLLVDMRAGSGFTPVSPPADAVGGETQADSVDGDECFGTFLISSAHLYPFQHISILIHISLYF